MALDGRLLVDAEGRWSTRLDNPCSMMVARIITMDPNATPVIQTDGTIWKMVCPSPNSEWIVARRRPAEDRCGLVRPVQAQACRHQPHPPRHAQAPV